MPVKKKSAITSRTKSKTSLQIPQETEQNWVAKTFRNKFIVVALAIIVLAGLLYYFRSLFIVAIVNGQPIDRISFTKELEKAAGPQILSQLVTKTLVLQEAKKQNVAISDNEIAAEMKKIEDQLTTQGQKLDDALAAQSMTRKDLQEQIRIQKLAEKILAKEVEITDKEVDDYVTQNKDALQQSSNSGELKKQVKEQLKQQKLQERFRTWLQELQQKAKILYFVNSK